MLELLVKGLLLWAYDLILECVSFIGDVLLDVFRMDTAYFKEHAPVVVELQHIFIGTGWALLLGNLVFQSLRSMVSGIGIDAEDPKFLFCCWPALRFAKSGWISQAILLHLWNCQTVW